MKDENRKLLRECIPVIAEKRENNEEINKIPYASVVSLNPLNIPERTLNIERVIAKFK